jgi:preprotein translocase subunit SecF
MIYLRLQQCALVISAIFLFTSEIAWSDDRVTTTVELADGTLVTLEHPENTTREKLLRYAEERSPSGKAKKVQLEKEQKARKAQVKKENAEYQKASEKRRLIYNACYLDKSKGLDLSNREVRQSLRNVCDDIADDPSWVESMKYD